MRPPFPGMDPWLEHPGLWQDVHNSLIAAIREELASKVAPKYFVNIDQNAYITTASKDEAVIRPDIGVGRTATQKPAPYRSQGGTATAVAVAEPEVEVDVDVAVMDVLVPFEVQVADWYLEIRTVAKRKLITVIEVLSPTNKSPGSGRKEYLRKRRRIFRTNANLIEIDLLRDGRPMPLMSEPPVSRGYEILVSRGASRPQATLYAFGVRHRIPSIPIPLLPEDPEPTLDLNAVLHALYDRARFDLQLDYTKPPVPPLDEREAAWASQIVAARAEAR